MAARKTRFMLGEGCARGQGWVEGIRGRGHEPSFLRAAILKMGPHFITIYYKRIPT